MKKTTWEDALLQWENYYGDVPSLQVFIDSYKEYEKDWEKYKGYCDFYEQQWESKL